jgi:hypothetical protein
MSPNISWAASTAPAAAPASSSIRSVRRLPRPLRRVVGYRTLNVRPWDRIAVGEHEYVTNIGFAAGAGTGEPRVTPGIFCTQGGRRADLT